MVASASARGFRSAPSLSINPRARVSAKGRPAAMVKTFAGTRSSRREIGEKRFGLFDSVGRADMDPHAVETDTVKSPVFHRAIPQRVHRKCACGRIFENPRMHDLHARIGEGRKAMLGNARDMAFRIE